MTLVQQIAGVQKDTAAILLLLQQLDGRIERIEKRLGVSPSVSLWRREMPVLSRLPHKVLVQPLLEILILSTRSERVLEHNAHLFISGDRRPMQVQDLVGVEPRALLELKGFGKTAWRELEGNLVELMKEHGCEPF